MKLLKAKVQFEEGRRANKYDYLTDLTDLKQGDNVVVETRNGYQVALFDMYTDDAPRANSLILQKVDEEKGLRIHTKIKHVEELKAKIEARMKERTFVEQAKAFAADDEELKSLIDTYEGLI